MELIEFQPKNRDAILELLDPDIVEVVDDDMTIITKSKGFGKPIMTMADGRVKREVGCSFSGMEPYLDTVSIDIACKQNLKLHTEFDSHFSYITEIGTRI